MKRQGKHYFDTLFYDFTIKFCEQHYLHSLFLDCKLNPLAFYAFAKYRALNLTNKWLLKAINQINKTTDNEPF